MDEARGDSLKIRYEGWVSFGRPELVDCIAYHKSLGLTRFHTAPYPLQPTWQRLIRLLLAAKGKEPTNGSIRTYQAMKWGPVHGESCVVELSALAAPSLKTERDSTLFRDRRISVLRERMQQFKPRVIVTYGLGCKTSFERLAGGSFDNDGFLRKGATVLMQVPSPTAFGQRNDDWVEYGRKLRERLLNTC